MRLCNKHTQCEAHRRPAKDPRWEKRPLGCRLGVHRHWKREANDRYEKICLVCGYRWTHHYEDNTPLMGPV